MLTGKRLWGALLLAGGALELYGIAHPGRDDTLSELTRSVFQTDTAAGRIIFAVAWTGFAGWYVAHIVGGSNEEK